MKQESFINDVTQQLRKTIEDDSLQGTPHSQNRKLSKDEFIRQLQVVKEAESVQGVTYSHIEVHEKKIQGMRESTQQPFTINMESLYQAYTENEVINTSVLKKYVNNRVQSPAYAILIKMGLIK